MIVETESFEIGQSKLTLKKNPAQSVEEWCCNYKKPRLNTSGSIREMRDECCHSFICSGPKQHPKCSDEITLARTAATLSCISQMFSLQHTSGTSNSLVDKSYLKRAKTLFMRPECGLGSPV